MTHRVPPRPSRDTGTWTWRNGCDCPSCVRITGEYIVRRINSEGGIAQYVPAGKLALATGQNPLIGISVANGYLYAIPGDTIKKTDEFYMAGPDDMSRLRSRRIRCFTVTSPGEDFGDFDARMRSGVAAMGRCDLCGTRDGAHHDPERHLRLAEEQDRLGG